MSPTLPPRMTSRRHRWRGVTRRSGKSLQEWDAEINPAAANFKTSKVPEGDRRRFNLIPSHNGQAAPFANGTTKIRTRGDARDDINGLYARANGRDFPSVRRWGSAARAT